MTKTILNKYTYACLMNEVIWLGISAIVFIVGMLIGIMLLRRTLQEQVEYEQKLQELATKSKVEPTTQEPSLPMEIPPPMEKSPEEAPSVSEKTAEKDMVSSPPSETLPPPPTPDIPAPPKEIDREKEMKKRLKDLKVRIEELRREGADVRSAEKILKLANSSLYSGDFERSEKYAKKTEKLIEDIKSRMEAETPISGVTCPSCGADVEHGAPVCPSCHAVLGEGAKIEEKSEEEEIMEIIKEIQDKLATMEDSDAKSEIENYIRLATTFARSKSYKKAMKYAKQAKEKCEALLS